MVGNVPNPVLQPSKRFVDNIRLLNSQFKFRFEIDSPATCRTFEFKLKFRFELDPQTTYNF